MKLCTIIAAFSERLRGVKGVIERAGIGLIRKPEKDH